MRFFFYGTLIAGSGNRVAQRAHLNLRALGPGRVRGLLHAVPDPLGWYPAMLPGERLVEGVLYEASGGFGPAHLARLDAYEDYDPASPHASLYRREEVEAVTAAGTARAQAYLFNQPLPEGACAISSGSFHGWLAEHGLAPFRDRDGV